jgi:hypothetical protein
MRFVSILVLAAAFLSACSSQTPVRPDSATTPAQSPAVATPSTSPSAGASTTMAAGGPGYEPAYYGGTTVTINAIELQQNAPEQAQADFYEVVYPTGWQTLGIGTPQCNPCDHDQNGIDALDYHDHILDSIPSSPGHGEYRALWRVFVVVPNYTGDPAHDAAVTTAYAAHIPTKSEAAVEALLDDALPDGSPVALEINTHFYFLCAVVSAHAVH